jgi:hypothetical protein
VDIMDDAPDIITLLDQIQDIDYWRAFAPTLSISNAPADTAPLPRDPETDATNRARFIDEGYLLVRDLGWTPPFEDMIDVMVRLKSMGLPAALLGIYDAPWIMAAQVRALMNNLVDGPAQLVPDFWGWVVEPGSRGFTAHRDRPEGSIRADGAPITITMWAPLKPATAENSGIYVIPANYDVGYLNPERQPEISPHESRAVPSDPGDIVLWTGRVIHWGGRSSPWVGDNRVSIAWEFQDARHDPVEGFVMETYPDIPFHTRLALIARQMTFYREREFGGETWQTIIDVLSRTYPIETLARRT